LVYGDDRQMDITCYRWRNG